MKKRQLFLGHVSAFPSSFALPHLPARRLAYPMPGSGILTRFPFGRCGDQCKDLRPNTNQYPKALSTPLLNGFRRYLRID